LILCGPTGIGKIWLACAPGHKTCRDNRSVLYYRVSQALFRFCPGHAATTILTSQTPVDKWHAVIGDPTYADAILDRLVHNAHCLDLAGDSLRRTRPRAAAKD
jgi:DNA replication protein DnaC